jgi:hypothetical protein
MPDDLKPAKPLLDDYRQALGLAFAIDDGKGARFFPLIARPVNLLCSLRRLDFMGQGS